MLKKVAHILNYPISMLGLDEQIDLAWGLLRSGKSGYYLACANPHSLVVAAKDSTFEQALKKSDILLPDGVGIILAAKILHEPIYERVTGFDFFQGFLQWASRNGGLRCFFLGSTERVLTLIKVRLESEYPAIDVVGTYSPSFSREFTEHENTRMLEAVNSARPDVLWVGMTAPKQEKWIYNNRDKLEVPLIAAIGAVFDYYAGTRKRAPHWICALGLEWLPRFLRDPRRLWRRNVISAPVFCVRILQEKITRIMPR